MSACPHTPPCDPGQCTIRDMPADPETYTLDGLTSEQMNMTQRALQRSPYPQVQEVRDQIIAKLTGEPWPQ